MKFNCAIVSTASAPDEIDADCSEIRTQHVRSLWLSLLWLTLLLPMGCSDRDASSNVVPVPENSGPPRVVVTSYALQSMVSEIVGDAATVVLLPANRGSSQLPLADEIQQLQTADLILLSGAGYEPWLQTVSLPKSRMTDTSDTYQQRLLTAADTVTHQHGPRGADANDNLISKTWLAPEFAIAQARHAERRLISLLPENAEQIAARAQALVARLESIQATVQQLAETTDNVTVFATTSDFAYLVQSLGWKLQRVQAASGLPKPGTAETGLILIFAFQHTSPESLPDLQDERPQLVRIDALESPTEEDEKSFTDRLQQNISAIRTALEAARSNQKAQAGLGFVPEQPLTFAQADHSATDWRWLRPQSRGTTGWGGCQSDSR